jgi:phosphate:Na+ symporter
MGLSAVIFLQCGLDLGRAFNTWLVSLRTSGVEKQMLMLPVLFHFIGGVLFTVINIMETYLGIPLMQWLLTHMTDSRTLHIPNFNLIYCLVVCLIMTVFKPQFMTWLQTRYRPSTEEQLGVPQFLVYAPINDIALALDLVEKEQLRLLERLPDYLQSLRLHVDQKPRGPLAMEHRSLNALCDQIHRFLQDLLQQPGTRPDDASRLLKVLERQQLLTSLIENLYQFCNIKPAKSQHIARYVLTLTESLDFFILQLYEELLDPAEADLNILQKMTSEKSDVLQQIRDACLQQYTDLTLEEKHSLFNLGMTFERVTWLVHQMAMRG